MSLLVPTIGVIIIYEALMSTSLICKLNWREQFYLLVLFPQNSFIFLLYPTAFKLKLADSR